MIRKLFLVIKNDTHIHNFFFFAVLVICFLKLFLVGTNEIISIPNDSVNYLRQSQIAIRDIGAPPGYPFWLALSSIIGLPQRVAIEILYLFASLAVVFALAKIAGRFFALMLFGVLAFLPATFFLFDNALSDGFFTCMTLIALAPSIGVLLDQDSAKFSFWIRLLLLAFILGLMLITRNEDYLVVGWIFWLIGCRFLLQKQNRPLKQVFREAALCSTLLLLGTFSVGGVVSSYHFVTKGVFARTISTLPSHMELLKNLASINNGAPITRVPITKVQREAAYLASSTLKRLRDHIENPKNMYQLASSRAGIPLGEIGAGWIWHVFNDAAIQKISISTLKDLNEFYLSVNSELSKKFKHGNIEKKFVIHPLVAGNVSGLLTNLSQSVVSVFKGLFESVSWQPDNEFESNLFDSGCLRRTSLVDFRAYGGNVQGWAFVDHAGSSITKIEVGVFEVMGGMAGAKWFTTELFARPDVIKGFAVEGRFLSEVKGFRVSLSRVRGDTVVVRYFFSDGSYHVTPPLVANKVTRIKHDSTIRFLEIFQGIDSVGKILGETSYNNIEHKFQEWLAGVFAKYFPYIVAVILIMAAIIVIISKKITVYDRTSNFYKAVVILIGGIFSQRILFYILVDAVGWDVDVRYLASALVLLIVASAVLVAYSFRTINGFFTALSERR